MSSLYAALDAMHRARTKYRQMAAIDSKIRKASFPAPELTADQKHEIAEYWRRYQIRMNSSFHRWYYAVSGLQDVRMIPNWYFENTVLPFYNKTGFSSIPQNAFLHQGWTDKSYFDRFFPDLRFPKTIVRNVNGYFLDERFEPLTFDESVRKVKEQPKVVIKPSLRTGGGLHVELVQNCDTIADVMRQYEKDYVIQAVVEQHPKMNLLNESSVNVVRITSFLFHGQVHLLSACVRVGAPGKFTDNYIDEFGGSMLTIGIDSAGLLKEKAFFANGSCVKECLNGFAFAGASIPAYSKMQEIAVRAHKKIPCFGLIGWDFVVEQDGIPTVMEYNLSSPGITYYQYCNGPFFGDLTDQVLADVSGKELR